MLTGDAKKPAELKDLRENHTETTVSFTLTAEQATIDLWEKDAKGLMGKFKLTSSLSTANMTMFNAEGSIQKFDSPEHVLDAFYDLRLEFYVKRKANLIKKIEAEKLTLSNKARFVEEVCTGELVVSNRKRKDILEQLRDRGYDLITSSEKPMEDVDDTEDDDQETDLSVLSKGYDYLLGMKIWSLTFERAQQLREQLAEKTEELELLMATAPSQLWLNDLDAVDSALDIRDQLLQENEDDERRAQKKNKARNKKIAAKKSAASRKKKPKKKDEWDSELEDDSDDGGIDLSDDDDGGLFLDVKPPKPKAKAAPKPLSRARSKPVAAKSVKATASLSKIKAVLSPPPSDIEDGGLGSDVLSGSGSHTSLQGAKKRALQDDGSSSSSESEDEFAVSLSDRVKKTVASKKPVSVSSKKRPAPAASKKKPTDRIKNVATKNKSFASKPSKSPQSSDSDDDISFSDNVKKNPKKRPSPRANESDSDDDVVMVDSVEKPKRSTKAPATKRRVVKETIDLSDESVSMETEKKVKKPSNQKATKKFSDESDEDELSFLDKEESDDESLPEATSRPARSQRQARNNNKIVYNLEASDDEDSDEDFE